MFTLNGFWRLSTASLAIIMNVLTFLNSSKEEEHIAMPVKPEIGCLCVTSFIVAGFPDAITLSLLLISSMVNTVMD